MLAQGLVEALDHGVGRLNGEGNERVLPVVFTDIVRARSGFAFPSEALVHVAVESSFPEAAEPGVVGTGGVEEGEVPLEQPVHGDLLSQDERAMQQRSAGDDFLPSSPGLAGQEQEVVARLQQG